MNWEKERKTVLRLIRGKSREDCLQVYADIARISISEDAGDETLREKFAIFGRHDLFFLLLRLLRRADVNRDWIFDRIREFESASDGYLDLWAREHYKSTIITFGATIQEIIRDPEITIGIFSHTRPIAKAFLRQIKHELETNDLLKELYPYVFWKMPKLQSPKWSEDEGITVRRRSNPKEATVEAFGMVDGQPTSRHYRLIVFDDVVTRESVNTPDMIEKTTKAWELSLNLTSSMHSDEPPRKRYSGTRYHYNDTYRTIIDRGAAIPRIYPATDTGKVDGNPILLTREQLAEKRRHMGPYTFACQMLQDPREDSVHTFSMDWVQYWRADQYYNLNLGLLCDPANEKKKDNDYTVFCVVGRGSDDNLYVVTWIRDRLNLVERSNILFALHRQYRPLFTGYEKYGKDADIEHYYSRMMRENYRFPIVSLGGNIPKKDRISMLFPLFEAGSIYLPETCIRVNYENRAEDLTKIFIEDEYKAFPFCVHDDMLDCLARVADKKFRLPRPRGRVQMQEEEPTAAAWS